MSRLVFALRELARGSWVFPVEEGGKLPHLQFPGEPSPRGDWRVRWGDAATSDPRQVVAWWSKWPDANIGVAAKPSQLLVVDCDMKLVPFGLRGTPYGHLHGALGPIVGGDDAFRAMCARYSGDWQYVASTYAVTTGSGGAHYYFRWPPEVKATQGSPIPGYVDVRCNGGSKGGYVLGAGSSTAKGDYTADNANPVLPVPDWLLAACKERAPVRPPAPRRDTAGPVGGLVEAVRSAQSGNRNNVTLWAARCMCSDGHSLQTAEAELVPAALDAGLPEREAQQTIRSAYRLQSTKGT